MLSEKEKELVKEEYLLIAEITKKRNKVVEELREQHTEFQENREAMRDELRRIGSISQHLKTTENSIKDKTFLLIGKLLEFESRP